MKHSVALVGVAGIFILGCVCGTMAMHLYVSHQRSLDEYGIDDRHAHRSGHAQGHLDFLTEHLELTPEQAEQIKQIRQSCHAKGKRIHEEMLPRVHELMDESGDLIKAILTPEQQLKYDELTQNHRSTIERFILAK
jgi:Spy/CpxP family protein refolding chaperone